MNVFLLQLSRWNWVPYVVLAVFFGWQGYDTFMPVVWMHVEVSEKSADNIGVRMHGYKVRDCKYLGIQAYSINEDGIRSTDTQIRRIDTAALGMTRPKGHYDMGLWDIRPITGARGVIVFVQHSCDETDLRTTKMAEVHL